jgi:hypothetical protein
MSRGNYQRRYLRAPFKETVLYVDSSNVLKGRSLNLSEMGVLLDEIPSLPQEEVLQLMISVPSFPLLKNFSLAKLRAFDPAQLERKVIKIEARLARREELVKDLDNLFRSRFGLEFVRIQTSDQEHIKAYVDAFAANLIHLQTLIDSYNSDEDTRLRTRVLSQALGYPAVEKIAQLRTQVSHDYGSLTWL